MDATLLRRLRTYQSERFPLVAYVPLMGIATFAAVAFSWGSRSAADATTGASAAAFPWSVWLAGLYTVLVFFFFLRVLDEHKDAPDDARYRPELPVPRGLVTLRELRGVALLALAAAIALNALIEPSLLVLMAVVLAWAGFMGREFFVRDWLRAHPGWYLLSHMVVMPLIFLYATALDWTVAGADPPAGITAFLALAFCNGLVIEVGRKIRPPDDEREGVDTYSATWGVAVATGLWVAAVMAAGALVVLTAQALAEPVHGAIPMTVVGGAVVLLVLAAAVPALLLMRGSPRISASHVETAAGLWVLASYAIVAALGWSAGVAG